MVDIPKVGGSCSGMCAYRDAVRLVDCRDVQYLETPFDRRCFRADLTYLLVCSGVNNARHGVWRALCGSLIAVKVWVSEAIETQDTQ